MEVSAMAGRKRKYVIALTNEERNQIKSKLRNRDISSTIRKRCQILLALDANQATVTSYEQCSHYLDVSRSMIDNVVKQYALEGIESLLTLKRNINSDNANRKIDGAMEARIVAMACGPAPEGRARWTVKLITEQARIRFELTVGEEAVRRVLKKTNCVLT